MLLLAVSAVLLCFSASPTAADNQLPDYLELFAMDCNAGLHIYPGHPVLDTHVVSRGHLSKVIDLVTTSLVGVAKAG